MSRLSHDIGHVNGLIFYLFANLALGDRVAAELARQHD